MEALFIEIFKGVNTEEEIQAQIKFHSSSLGQSIINKEPLVLGKLTKSMEKLMLTPPSPKLKALEKKLHNLIMQDKALESTITSNAWEPAH